VGQPVPAPGDRAARGCGHSERGEQVGRRLVLRTRSAAESEADSVDHMRLVLRTRSAAESEADSVDHMRRQQHHQNDVTPGVGHPLSLNLTVPPYPQGSKPRAPRNLEGVPGSAPASSSVGKILASLPLCAAAARLFTIYCLQLGAGDRVPSSIWVVKSIKQRAPWNISKLRMRGRKLALRQPGSSQSRQEGIGELTASFLEGQRPPSKLWQQNAKQQNPNLSEGKVTVPDIALTPNDQIPLCPTGATKLVPTGACATDPPCRIRASLSVPIGGDSLGRVPPGFLHEFEALVQGWGEKCCLLKLGVPTGAGPCRKTRVPGMPEKLVRGAEEEDGELPDGSMDAATNLGDAKVNGAGSELDAKGIDIGLKSDTLDGCASSCVLLEGGVGLLDGRVSGAPGVLLVELLQLFAAEDGVHSLLVGWNVDNVVACEVTRVGAPKGNAFLLEAAVVPTPAEKFAWMDLVLAGKQSQREDERLILGSDKMAQLPRRNIKETQCLLAEPDESNTHYFHVVIAGPQDSTFEGDLQT
ncbi:hypothetical protein HPG69_016994, partial [Diceros bicornis minor]